MNQRFSELSEGLLPIKSYWLPYQEVHLARPSASPSLVALPRLSKKALWPPCQPKITGDRRYLGRR